MLTYLIYVLNVMDSVETARKNVHDPEADGYYEPFPGGLAFL